MIEMNEVHHRMKNNDMITVSGIFPGYKKSRTFRVRTWNHYSFEEDLHFDTDANNVIGRVRITYGGPDKYEVWYGSSCYQFNFTACLYKRKPHLLHILKMNNHYTHKDDMCIKNGSMFKCILEAIEEVHFTFPPKRSEEELAPKTLWQKIRNYLRSDNHPKTYVEWVESKEYLKWWKENDYGWIK